MFRDCVDKLVGVFAPAAWGAAVAGGAPEAALGLLEPVTGVAIAGTVLALHLRDRDKNHCSEALNRAQKRIEANLEKAFASDRVSEDERRTAATQMEGLTNFLKTYRPSYADLVGKWKLDRKQIAEGIVAEAAEAGVTGRWVPTVIETAINDIADDESLYGKLAPEVARQQLAALADIRTTLSRIADDIGAIRKATEALQAKYDLTHTAKEALTVEVARLQVQLATTIDVVRGFVRTIEGWDVPADQIIPTLIRIAASWADTARAIGALAISRNLSPRILELRDRAQVAHQRGMIDEVRAFLDEIEAAERSAYEALVSHQDEIEREVVLRRSGLLAALAARETFELTQLRFANVAAAIAERIRISSEPDTAFASLRGACEEWLARGRENGLTVDLAVAVELARISVRIAVGSADRIASLNNLGNALSSLGILQTGTASLKEAIQVYQEAIRNAPRELVPLVWAKLQSNLGGTLSIVGKREADTATLQASIVAHRAALEERTRDRAPAEWAISQSNLGVVLLEIAKREADFGKLLEATSAFRAALEESKSLAPLELGATLTNFGNALVTIGEQTNELALIEGAVEMFVAALSERTRERAPYDWAETQNNLGNALTTLGERDRGVARLEEAIAAFRAALDVWTRERTPVQWGTAQHNLGSALKTAAVREGSRPRLEAAIASYRLALDVRAQASVPLLWANTQTSLANALLSLGELEPGTARVEEAIAAYREAQLEQRREAEPLGWALTQYNLAAACLVMCERSKSFDLLDEASGTIAEAIAVFRHAGAAYYVGVAESLQTRIESLRREHGS